MLDPQNMHKKEFWTHETPTSKNFGSTKYPQENNLDPQNTHGKKVWTYKTLTKAQ